MQCESLFVKRKIRVCGPTRILGRINERHADFESWLGIGQADDFFFRSGGNFQPRLL